MYNDEQNLYHYTYRKDGTEPGQRYDAKQPTVDEQLKMVIITIAAAVSSRSSRLRIPSRCISPSLRAGRRPTRTARTVWA